MKWRFTIAISTFALISFSSSAPIIVPSDVAIMYPIEYYPAFLQPGNVHLDFASWFRKAADSIKHFCNHVNNLISNEIERIFGNPAIKQTTNVANDPHDADIKHPAQESNFNPARIQAFEIHKDAEGNLILKKLGSPDGNEQILQNIPANSGVEIKKPTNNVVNPFRWNEDLEKDELFTGAFKDLDASSRFLWHSGIFPFQPISAFNAAEGEKLFDFQASQNQSSQPPSDSDKPQSIETSSQKIEQNDTSTSTADQTEISTTVESQPEEISDSSSSSNDETVSSDDSNLYETNMSIERIKQNNSNSDGSADVDSAKSETPQTQNNSNSDGSADVDSAKSETPQTSSVSDETNDQDSDNNDDEDTNDENNDDDDDNSTDFETMQISSDDESDHSDQKSQEPETIEKSSQQTTNDENKSSVDDEDITIVETSAPSKGTDKVEITEKTSDPRSTTVNIVEQDSDESDIAKKVLAIVQPKIN